MKKRLLKYFPALLFFTVLFSGFAIAQGVNPRSTEPLSKWDRRFPEIRVGDKIYQTGSNWLTFGAGPGYSTTLGKQQVNMALAYHFRYKPVYFKLGYHYSDKNFFWQERDLSFNNDIVTAAGIRIEENHFNLAFFVGPTIAFGSIENIDNENLGEMYYALGVMPELQLTYKYFYDLGIGLSLYGSFNKQHQCVGTRLHFYFSGAYREEY